MFSNEIIIQKYTKYEKEIKILIKFIYNKKSEEKKYKLRHKKFYAGIINNTIYFEFWVEQVWFK